jgi:hypothetical protein
MGNALANHISRSRDKSKATKIQSRWQCNSRNNNLIRTQLSWATFAKTQLRIRSDPVRSASTAEPVDFKNQRRRGASQGHHICEE